MVDQGNSIKIKDMKLHGIVSIFTLISPFLSWAQIEDYSESFHKVDSAISNWVTSGKLVSSEILVLEDGKAVFHKAYGDTEVNSIWQIKSMTKPITATAALTLVEKGALSLDEKVSKYIPEFSGNEFTKVKNLINHTTGYDYMITGWEGVDYGFEEWVKSIASTKPDQPFGKFYYSDFNIAALGYIVSLVSGQSIEQFTHESVLKPLRMNDTYTWFTPDSSWASRINKRYRWNQEQRSNELIWTPEEDHQWPFYKAVGGIYTTAKDYAKFMQSWLDHTLLEEETIVDQLSIGCPNGYGGGWSISGPLFYHGGYDGTEAYALPDNRIIILMAHSIGNDHKPAFRNLINTLD